MVYSCVFSLSGLSFFFLYRILLHGLGTYFFVVFLGLLRPVSVSLLRVCAVLCMSVASTGFVTTVMFGLWLCSCLSIEFLAVVLGGGWGCVERPCLV